MTCTDDPEERPWDNQRDHQQRPLLGELEKAQNEASRTTLEKKPSIRARLENAKRECVERKALDKPAPQKKPPELGDL